MMILDRPYDKNFPFEIRDAWGGIIYIDREGLEELKKEIEKILDNPTKK